MERKLTQNKDIPVWQVVAPIFELWLWEPPPVFSMFSQSCFFQDAPPRPNIPQHKSVHSQPWHFSFHTPSSVSGLEGGAGRFNIQSLGQFFRRLAVHIAAQIRFCKSCVRVKKRMGKFCRVFATATTPFFIFIQFLSPNHRPQAFCLFFFFWGGVPASLPSVLAKTKKTLRGPRGPERQGSGEICHNKHVALPRNMNEHSGYEPRDMKFNVYVTEQSDTRAWSFS